MKNNRPKILFFITEDWFVCSHWLPLIEGAKNTGFEVVVVTRINRHEGEILQHGVKVIEFDISRRGSNVFRELKVILQLMRIYREEQPDIVHHVAMKPMLYGSLASHLLRVPHTVNWVAGMGWLFVSGNRRAKILRGIIRRALGVLLRRTSVIVENKDDQAIIADIGIAAQHIHLVRGAGVDTLLYSPCPEPVGIPLVVLPARMLWDKGVGEFVGAARQLQQRGVKAKLVLVGDPDTENPASVPERQLKDWQNEGVVEWWGRREDMPQVLAQSHIVCLPSYREGLPKALLEAASCGLPIVTTDVPGCREIVRDGDNGLLVEAYNATALADALARLLSDPGLRQQMGLRGRERVLSEFSQERIVAQVLALYSEILS
ncbi:MAG: glycosyl transferase family 1 [Betaproteobacteria bacterium RBG_16_56_24]|nr:MAG: glycosyl transferase family 1 [Betaproteobacteria bacterium RBG_16_56_24]